jgi:fatty-acyl-CoA synthase
MFALIGQLYRTDLLTIIGLIRLIEALVTTGVNLMAMLRIAAKLHPQRIAVIDDKGQLSYHQLWQQAETLAIALHSKYPILHSRGTSNRRKKVAILCRNHGSMIKSIFAGSRLGAHVFLLNPDMSAEQILELAASHQFDLWIYDEHREDVFVNSALSQKAIPAYHPIANSIERISLSPKFRVRLPKVKTGNIVVMTGGTTGKPKPARRKPAIFDFLPPFLGLLNQVHLDRYRSVYIATPIYHGFGVASLLIGIVLGSTMYVTTKFNAERCCELIAQEQIEVVTLVPLMLQRILEFNSAALSSLRCIITGGALLNPVLAKQTGDRLGEILFNLYGTSEAGFCIMATPATLAKKPASIGKAVNGVRASIIGGSDPSDGTSHIGRLCIRSAWTTCKDSWIETGDLAYRDLDGDLFLCGRIDDMIVSGGENVYPIELENILIQHPDLDAVGVLGIPDREFGQRLKAVVQKKAGSTLDRATLLLWLKPRTARHQMPAIVEFRDELPYTALGKLDKKLL